MFCPGRDQKRELRQVRSRCEAGGGNVVRVKEVGEILRQSPIYYLLNPTINQHLIRLWLHVETITCGHNLSCQI